MAYTKICTKCNTSRSENDFFCYRCGEKLETLDRKCFCGKVLDLSDYFCPICGKKAEEVKR